MCSLCGENPENDGCRLQLTRDGNVQQRIPVCYHCFRWVRATLDWIKALPESANA